MRENDFEESVITLVRLSAEWFKAHHSMEISQRFVLYVTEAQSGSLQQHYARILDGSLECMIGIQPLLASRLASEVSRVAQMSSLRLRPLLSMIVYWLTQFHNGKRNGLPDSIEMLDIFHSILNRRVLTFHRC